MKNGFVETLVAAGGHQILKDKLEPYAGFIGSWDFDWVGHNDDGTTWTVPGQWHFSWILEGRAIQDIWICPAIDLRSSGSRRRASIAPVSRLFRALRPVETGCVFLHPSR